MKIFAVKKMILILALGSATLSLLSCKKTRTCTCSSVGTAKTYNSDIELSNRDANTWCDSYRTYGGFSSCTLK